MSAITKTIKEIEEYYPDMVVDSETFIHDVVKDLKDMDDYIVCNSDNNLDRLMLRRILKGSSFIQNHGQIIIPTCDKEQLITVLNNAIELLKLNVDVS